MDSHSPSHPDTRTAHLTSIQAYICDSWSWYVHWYESSKKNILVNTKTCIDWHCIQTGKIDSYSQRTPHVSTHITRNTLVKKHKTEKRVSIDTVHKARSLTPTRNTHESIFRRMRIWFIPHNTLVQKHKLVTKRIYIDNVFKREKMHNIRKYTSCKTRASIVHGNIRDQGEKADKLGDRTQLQCMEVWMQNKK